MTLTPEEAKSVIKILESYPSNVPISQWGSSDDFVTHGAGKRPGRVIKIPKEIRMKYG